MKTKFSAFKAVLFALITLPAVSSCNKGGEEPVTPIAAKGKVVVNFSNEVDGQPITSLNMGSLRTNGAGNQYNIALLKYYVSNFTLVKEDGSETNFKNYKLIDGSDASTGQFTLDSVANGNYTSVKFYLGVDAARNHTGAQDGDLDPINGMIWTWNTGYIFFKHEGQYKDNSGQMQSLVFHYGTDPALATITVPVTKFEVSGNTKNLFLKFNLNSLYTSPANIDFNVDNNHQSDRASDAPWIATMKSNVADAFSFDKVQ